MTASRPEAAGLLACCLLFLAMPKDLMSVGAADRRLIPAIVTMAAIFVRGPSPRTAGASSGETTFGARDADAADRDPGERRRPEPARKTSRSEAVATALLAGTVIAKFGLLLYLWAPLKHLDEAYAKIAAHVPPDAIVFFVPPVTEARPDAIRRTKRFWELASRFRRIPPADAHLFVEHPHLLLLNFAGRNVLPAQVFTNFWAKRTAEFSDLPDPAKSQTSADAAEALAQLPAGVASYIVSHIELDEFLKNDASHKIADVDDVKLYVVCGVKC